MTKPQSGLLFVVLCLLVSRISYGDSVEACSVIKADLQRLACYDGFLRVSPEHAQQRFGAEDLAETISRRKSQQLDEIQSEVLNVKKHPYGKSIFELANGQVWTEQESTPRKYFKTGDKVTVKRSLVGGYLLVNNRNDTARRVRRTR